MVIHATYMLLKDIDITTHKLTQRLNNWCHPTIGLRNIEHKQNNAYVLISKLLTYHTGCSNLRYTWLLWIVFSITEWEM